VSVTNVSRGVITTVGGVRVGNGILVAVAEGIGVCVCDTGVLVGSSVGNGVWVAGGGVSVQVAEGRIWVGDGVTGVMVGSWGVAVLALGVAEG